MSDSGESEDEVTAQLVELANLREIRLKDLATATTAYKKCRQMRGADAHKRAWYFEDKMKKYQEELDRLDREQAELEARRQPT